MMQKLTTGRTPFVLLQNFGGFLSVRRSGYGARDDPAPAIPPSAKIERHSMKGRMTPQAAARIQSATARSQGQVSKGSFAARAQSAAARNPAPSTRGTSHHGQSQVPAN